MLTKERQIGKVYTEGGRYFLDLNDIRTELPIGMLGDAVRLDKLVGKEVEVLFSEPIRFVVGIIDNDSGPLRQPILCYVPPPDLFRQSVLTLDKAKRVVLAKDLLRAGIISRATQEKIVGR
jgi:hypothetical protein